MICVISMPFYLVSELVSAERKQSDSSCSLNSEINLTLMLCACASYTARKNLTSFGNEAAKRSDVFVINGVYVIYAALADLSSRSSCSISSNHASLSSKINAFSERNVFVVGRRSELTKTALRLPLVIVGGIAGSAVIETTVVIASISTESIILRWLLLHTGSGNQRYSDEVRSHFADPSSLAIRCIIAAGRETTFYEYTAAFSELIAYSFCHIAPCHNVNPVCNLFWFSLWCGVIPIDCHSKRCYGTTGFCCANNRVSCQITHNLN